MTPCTQADVEIRLQRDLTADAPTIPDTVDGLIADAQAEIEGFIGRTVESAARTQQLDGGRDALFLEHWPVTAVATVTEDGIALTADDFTFYEHGKLVRLSGGYRTAWRTTKPKSVVVAYTGGFKTPEHDAQLEHLGGICAEIVARAIQKGADAEVVPAGAAGAVQSVALEGADSVTYATGGGQVSLAGGLTQFIYLTDDERLRLTSYKGAPFA